MVRETSQSFKIASHQEMKNLELNILGTRSNVSPFCTTVLPHKRHMLKISCLTLLLVLVCEKMLTLSMCIYLKGVCQVA